MPEYYNRHNASFLLDGDRNVGKTSLMRAYASGTYTAAFYDYDNYRLLDQGPTTIDGKNRTVYLRDLTERDRHFFTRLNYRRYDGVFLVFALNDRDTFETLTARREEILSHVDEDLRDFYPVVVLANKCDIPDYGPAKRCVTNAEVIEWCGKHAVPYGITSNREVDLRMMKYAMNAMIKKMVVYEATRDNRYRTPVQNIRLNDSNDHGSNRDKCSCSCS